MREWFRLRNKCDNLGMETQRPFWETLMGNRNVLGVVRGDTNHGSSFFLLDTCQGSNIPFTSDLIYI